jgi:hypothetical protein
VGARISNAQDLVDSWQHNNPMIHIEEPAASNFKNKEFETFVKQITTKESSKRAMHSDVGNYKNTTI